MDDFERAILACLDPTTDPITKARALDICQQVRDSPDSLSFVLSRLSPSTRPETVFWCLQYLHQKAVSQLLKSFSGGANPAEPLLPVLARNSVLDYASAVIAANESSLLWPPYVRNKLAQLIATFVAAEYPSSWPNALRDTILPLASDTEKTNMASLDFFFRVMRALDEDVTSIRAAQTSEEARLVSVRVKDAIREDCASMFVSILANLAKAPAYAIHTYDLIARNVEWLDLSLFANDAFLPDMYASITSAAPCATRAASAYALRAIVLKRMPPQGKLALLQHLQVITLLSAIPYDISQDSDYPSRDSNHEQLPLAELSIQSGRTEIAALVNCIASVALEILKSAGASRKEGAEDETPAAALSLVQSASMIAEAALPLALRFVAVDDDESTSAEALHCVNVYISTFSRLNDVKANDMRQNIANGSVDDLSWNRGRDGLIATLHVIEERACFPPDYDPTDEDHPFVALRHVLLKSVLRGIIRAVPAVVHSFIRQVAANRLTSSSIPRTELVFAMLTLLAETSPNVPGLESTLKSAMSNPPSFAPVPDNPSLPSTRQLEAVSIAYFELVVRCYRLILTSQSRTLLESVLAPFFDSRGMLHPTSEYIRIRASYLLLKITRPLRTLISANHLDAVMNAMQPLLFPVQPANAGVSFSIQMNIFETAGYMLGTDPSNSENVKYLGPLLQALVEALHHAASLNALIGIVTATGQLSKGFGGDSKPLLHAGSNIRENDTSQMSYSGKHVSVDETQDLRRYTNGSAEVGGVYGGDVKIERPKRLSAQVTSMWTSCLKAILTSTGVLGPNMSSAATLPDSFSYELKEKVMFVLHRMVDAIGVETVPYLNAVLTPLLKDSKSAVEVQSIVVLASQAVGKFADRFEPVIESVFAEVVQQVNQFPSTVDPVTRLAVSEDMREAAELQKSFLYLVHAILAYDISQVFVSDRNICLLHGLLSSLVHGVVGDVLDIRTAASVMKLCFSSLAKMVTLWITPQGVELITRIDERDGRPRGLAQFFVEEVSTACVRSPFMSSLFRDKDYSSGAAATVLSENISLQRTCVSRLGNTFGDALRKRFSADFGLSDVEAYINLLFDRNTSSQELLNSFLQLIHLKC